jgi:hypothetical protein
VTAKVKKLLDDFTNTLNPRANLSGKQGEKNELELEVEKLAVAGEASKLAKLKAVHKAAQERASLTRYELAFNCKTGPSGPRKRDTSDDGAFHEHEDEATDVDREQVARQQAKEEKYAEMQQARQKRLQKADESGIEGMYKLIKDQSAARATASAAAEVKETKRHEKEAEMQKQQLDVLLIIAGSLRPT